VIGCVYDVMCAAIFSGVVALTCQKEDLPNNCTARRFKAVL
jgi:hypothetical protein